MRGWRVGLGLLCGMCGIATAEGLEISGTIIDVENKSAINGVLVRITDEANHELVKGTSSDKGRVSLRLDAFAGTHVHCKLSSTLYDPVDLSVLTRDGKADCSARLTKVKGLHFEKLYVDDKATDDHTVILRGQLKNEAATSQTVDRFDIAGIWQSEQTCANPTPPATYDVVIDVPYTSVRVRDGAQDLSLKAKNVKFRIAEDRCAHTCLRFSFQPALSIDAGGERWFLISISKESIASKVPLPQGTSSAFQLRATYAGDRRATTETMGPETTKLMADLAQDKDCALQP